MNKVFLMGRLTDKPELRTTPAGASVTNFTIAVNRRFAKEGTQQSDFIRCSAWRQQAEFICKYFEKGSMICIIGTLQTRSWEDANSKKQYSTEVLAEEVHFTGEKRREATESTEGPDITFDDLDRTFAVSDDDLPF